MQENGVIAVIRNWNDITRAFRARKDGLNITFATLDLLAKLTDGFSSKLLAPEPLKRLGETTFNRLLRGSGTMLIMVEDPEAMARIRPRITQSRLPPVVLAVKNGKGRTRLVSKRFMRKIAPIGGRARMEKMTPKQRSAHGKKAIRARWHKPKLVEITDSASKSRATS